MKKKFVCLIVSPHPDDAELAMGATIFKMAQDRHKVIIVDMTDGEPTPFGNPQKRQKEAKKAAQILGVCKRINLGFPNRYLMDTSPARFALAELIRIYKPDIIFAPYFQDNHPDHIAAASIAKAARFIAKYSKVKLKGCPHYAKLFINYFCSHLHQSMPFSFLVDTSLYFKKKLLALRSYRSQFINNPNNRWVEKFIKNWNAFLGSLINADYAEPFFFQEAFRINSFEALLD